MPPQTWNRSVSYNSTSGYLEVSITGNNPNGNRNDTATSITVKSGDEPATILYHASGGVVLTGVLWKDSSGNDLPVQDPPPAGITATVGGNGNLLTMDDTGSATASYYYHVVGTVGGTSYQTEDPQIHNSA